MSLLILSCDFCLQDNDGLKKAMDVGSHRGEGHGCRKSLLRCYAWGVMKRQPKSHELAILCGRRPKDAWERRTLKNQMRVACERSARSVGYSRGPEIFKALEELKRRSLS